MKMNLECMKEMLLALEELLVFDNEMKIQPIAVKDIVERTPEIRERYHAHEMVYSLMKLQEAGYISAKWIDKQNCRFYGVSDITYEGHLYLNSIR